MQWIVTLYKGADRDAFIKFMQDNGIEFKEVENIPRVFYVNETFDHPSIQILEDGDWEFKPAYHSLISDAAFNNANWGIARMIRRNKPWVLDSRFEGINTFYDAVRDGDGVDIYVIDSGFNVSHDEFGGRATNVADYAGGGIDDGYGHGTACGAFAGGATVGTATASLLWSFKCFNDAGMASASSVLDAINGAIAHYLSRMDTNRPAVMNLSLSGANASTSAAVEAAISYGIVCVAAAGNDILDLDSMNLYPAETPGVICVGGSNANDGAYYTTSHGSNYGSQVDVLAPSQFVYTADHTGNSLYKKGNGTSYGCGLVSGLVACMLEGYGRLTNADQVAEVRARLIENATTGKFIPGPTPGTLPDRMAYFDPKIEIEPDMITPVAFNMEGSIIQLTEVEGNVDGEDVVSASHIRFFPMMMEPTSVTTAPQGDGRTTGVTGGGYFLSGGYYTGWANNYSKFYFGEALTEFLLAVRIEGLETGNDRNVRMILRDASFNQLLIIHVAFGPSGYIAVYSSSGSLLFNETGLSIPISVEHWLSAKIVNHTTNGSIVIALNGVEVLNEPVAAFGTDTPVDNIVCYTGASTGNIPRYHGIVISDGEGEGAFSDLLPELEMTVLRPTGSSGVDWAVTGAASAHEAVDETRTSATDYITTSVPGAEIEFTFPAFNTALGTVQAIQGTVSGFVGTGTDIEVTIQAPGGIEKSGVVSLNGTSTQRPIDSVGLLTALQEAGADLSEVKVILKQTGTGCPNIAQVGLEVLYEPV